MSVSSMSFYVNVGGITCRHGDSSLTSKLCLQRICYMTLIALLFSSSVGYMTWTTQWLEHMDYYLMKGSRVRHL